MQWCYFRHIKHWAACDSLAPSTETFTLDDALDACGFGKFQWKICLFTGLSWVSKYSKASREVLTVIPSSCSSHASLSTSLRADRRRHGADAPQRLGPPAALWVGAAQLWSSSNIIGKIFSEKLSSKTCWFFKFFKSFFCFRLYLSACASVHPHGGTFQTSTAED